MPSKKPLPPKEISAPAALNWPLYFARQHCTVWQAVLLTFGLPPTSDAYETLSGKRWKTFLNRRNILLQAMVERSSLGGRESPDGRLFICHPAIELNNRPVEADDQYLDLYEFASFAKKHGLTAPPELLAVAVEPMPATAEPVRAVRAEKLRINPADDDDKAKKSDKKTNNRGYAARANGLSKILASVLPLVYPQAEHPDDFKAYWAALHERLGDQGNDDLALAKAAVLGHLKDAIRDHRRVAEFSIQYSKTHAQ